MPSNLSPLVHNTDGEIWDVDTENNGQIYHTWKKNTYIFPTDWLKTFLSWKNFEKSYIK